MTVSALWLFLTVPWVGVQCVIVVFPDHTHFLLTLYLIETPFNAFANRIDRDQAALVKIADSHFVGGGGGFLIFISTLYLIEKPFNTFANKADPDQAALVIFSCKNCLIRVYSICLWKYD